MKAVIYNQGFNLVEHRQIINLERAKLNRFLDEERRIVEILTGYAIKEIEIKPQMLKSIEGVWRNVADHRLVREIRRRVDCLTDAYPQFLQQVEAVRNRLRERFFLAVNAVRYAAQNLVCQKS